MFFYEEDRSGKNAALKLHRLATEWTSNLEFIDRPETYKGQKIRTKGIMALDETERYFASIGIIEYEPVSLYRKSYIGRVMLGGGRQPIVAISFVDNEIPESSGVIIANNFNVVTYHGSPDLDAKREIGHRITIVDERILSDVLRIIGLTEQ
ncbi:MAG TPA: hypothetical protein VLF63_03005 [Patescibacteria group bacterium]|nr:hypothetical protein [Patescibacteria group bacterium]